MFKDNTVLIIPSNIKESLIEKIRKDNKLLDITFITKNEFIKKVIFDYNNKSIYYLMNKYNIKYEVAKVYLDNIYYIEDTTYNSNKLNFLVNIKKELLDNNLLIIDKYYTNYLKTKNICVYGFDYIDKYFKKLLNEFDNVEIINKEYNDYEINTIYELQTMEEEIEFVAARICNLIGNNIDINKIKLIIPSEYNSYIERIFKLHNIPINLTKTSIFNTYIGNYFIENIESDINNTLSKIENMDTDIHNKIINILNKYTWCEDYTNVIEMLIHDFKNTYITNKLVNSIETISLKDNNITDEDYIFVLGFNQGSIPIIYKDEEYMTDNICDEVNIETTKEKNIKEKEIILNNLKNIKNLTITYKLKTNTDTYYISNLYDEINCNIKKIKEDNYKYSNLSNKIKLTKKLDNLTKYGIVDKDLGLLYNNYKIDYKSFDNKYTKIDKENLHRFLNNKLLLSYSSLDNYNKCSFRYYLSNILKISIYEETFMTNIGTIFHEVLSKMNNDNFNLEIEYENSINNLNKEFTIKEKFFLDKLKKELEFIIETIKKQTEFSDLDNYLYEEKIYTNIEGNISITFMGIVDKIMYKEYDNNTIVAIIDYKTGNPNTNLNNVIYGLDMQLPIYLYLAKNTNKLKNVEIAGFYLQKILNNEITKDYKNSYNKLKEDNLKLVGYSNDNINILSKFDTTYEDSRIVKSLKTSSKGFYAYSKTIDNDNIDKIVNIIENKIKENAKDIEDANFDINPKKQKDDLIGCKFCKFNDICFRKEEDIVRIKEYKDLDFID